MPTSPERLPAGVREPALCKPSRFRDAWAPREGLWPTWAMGVLGSTLPPPGRKAGRGTGGWFGSNRDIHGPGM